MKNNFRIANILIAAGLFIASCNLPSGQASQDAVLTAAAQTVEASISGTPTITATSVSSTPFPTLNINTNTPAATATSNCNTAQFVTDVTIPDGTILAPAAAFTKKWRLKNIGSCAWNGFSMVFDSGDAMSGPASKPVGAVSPGQEIDLEVNLTAPASVGNYRGYWRLVTSANVLVPIVNGYQGKSFYVDIKVQNAATPTFTLAPAIAQAILTGLPSEDGFVTSGGTINSNPNVGDNDSNEAVQAFVSFDMTSIPAGAHIVKVVVDFSGFDVLGAPWGLSDGCLRAYSQAYGTVDAGDYFAGAPSGTYIRWCGGPELSSAAENADMKTLVQSLVGASRLQLRLQFTSPNSNGNGVADMVRFGVIKLTVTYQ